MQVECTRCGAACEPGTPAGMVAVEVHDYSQPAGEHRVVEVEEAVCRGCLDAFSFSFAGDESGETETPTGSSRPGAVLDGDESGF